MTVSRVATITLSDFGIPVRVAAPPSADVTFTTLPAPTRANGVVVVPRSGGGTAVERGLLVVVLRLQNPNDDPPPRENTQLSAVDSLGYFSLNVLGTSNYPDTTERLDATFYPDPATKLACAAHSADRFVAGATATGVTFVC